MNTYKVLTNEKLLKEPSACPRCQQIISPYYLSKVKLDDGRVFMTTRCLSCGFFEDEK